MHRHLPHFVLLALSVWLLSLALFNDSSFKALLQEDGWVEWSTFAAFATAAIFGVRYAARKTCSGLERLALLGIAALCIFVAGEEISWGQRVLGFRPPDVFLEKNYQQEANLHNLLKNILDTRWMVFLIAVGYGVAAPALARWSRLPKVLAPAVWLVPWFALIALLEFSYPFELVGEFAELLMGLTFLSDVYQRGQNGAEQGPSFRFAWVQAGVLAAGILLVPLSEFMLTRDSGRAISLAEAELRVLAQALEQQDALTRRLAKKRRVHKRLYTAVKAGYLRLEREKFYLDPWHQPYWIVYQRPRSSAEPPRIFLYSFGPNRRRDTDVDKVPWQTAGDDIAVSVTWRTQSIASVVSKTEN